LGPGLAPAAHLHHDWAHPGRTCTGISVHRGRICRRSCLGSRNCRRYRKWCVTARRAQTRHALRVCAVEIAAGEVGVDRARGVVADSCVRRGVGLTWEDAMCQSMREWTVSCVRMDASRLAGRWSYACRWVGRCITLAVSGVYVWCGPRASPSAAGARELEDQGYSELDCPAGRQAFVGPAGPDGPRGCP
jgi:hypothetical protein